MKLSCITEAYEKIYKSFYQTPSGQDEHPIWKCPCKCASIHISVKPKLNLLQVLEFYDNLSIGQLLIRAFVPKNHKISKNIFQPIVPNTIKKKS